MAKLTTKNPRELPPVEVCFHFVASRFCGTIIWYLMKHKTLRYSELKRCLPYVNPKTLSSKLHEMEEEGIISRHKHGGIPPKVNYALTELGESLWPVVRSAHEWGLCYVRGLAEEDAPYTEDAREIYNLEDG